jgi:hypothetical protein
MTLREIKRQARSDLHQAMQVPALYLTLNPAYVEPVVDPDIPQYLETPVNIRVHSKFKALGDMKGTNFHFAEMIEEMPRLVFWREEFDNLERNAIVSVEENEAYRIDTVEPPDDQTVTAVCTRLDSTDANGLPVPESP